MGTAAFLTPVPWNSSCSALGRPQKPIDSNIALALLLSHLKVAFWSKRPTKHGLGAGVRAADSITVLALLWPRTDRFASLFLCLHNQGRAPEAPELGNVCYNAAMVLLLFEKYIFFHRGMKFKTRQTGFSNAANGGETLVPDGNWENALARASWQGDNICLCSTGSVWPLTILWSEALFAGCETLSQVSYIRYSFYSLCESMSCEHSSMGWQQRQIKHQRMRNAEIVAWLYGCTPAVELHFYSYCRVRSTQERFQVCSSWKQGVKPFQKPEAIDSSQRISS